MFFTRITTIIFFFVAFFIQNACFAANYEVKDLVIDNSDKTVLIRGSGNFQNTKTNTCVPIPNSNPNTSLNLINSITTYNLTNPAKYVIDIPNAELTGGSKYYKVKNSKVIQRIDLIQQETNITRIIFTLYSDKFLTDFKTYSDGINVIVKYDSKLVDNSIQHKFYTTSGDADKTLTPQNTAADIVFNSTNYTREVTPKMQNKYFLSMVNQSANGLILKGIGEISFQKVKYYDNNTRAEIILDSTGLLENLNKKTYSIPNGNKTPKTFLTINRISDKKTKLTLLGENLKDYRIVISPDNQSLFISHGTFVLDSAFALDNAKLTSYNLTKNANGYYIFDMNFNKPIAYDVFESDGSFYLDINNLPDFSKNSLKHALSDTDFNIKTIKTARDKTRYIIPTDKINFAYANIESNSKSIKLCFKEKPKTQTNAKEPIAALTPVNRSNITIVSDNAKNDANVVYQSSDDIQKIIFKEPKKKKPENTSISSLRKVVIDAGHGGSDSGAIGCGTILEKSLNLEVAKLIKERLEKKNVRVYMTRAKDEFISLEERANISNEISPDLFVSIHSNSTVKNTIYGLETHYYKDNSLELAMTIHEHFASYKNLKKWGTLDRGVIKSRFYVINHTEAPSVLVEMGFISNREEGGKLLAKKRQEEIADSVAEGILEYLKVK